MTEQPARIFTPEEIEWQIVDVRGTPMPEARVMNGEQGIYSAYYRLTAGMEIRPHRHVNWVQVTVLEGEMSVLHEGAWRDVPAGGCYFVPTGGRHAERANVDTLVMVTSPDP
jgi:quercetin dioxygenase-like cupin family protein